MGFITIILLIPYFGWGIYALRHRFRYHEEFPAKIEAATLGAVVLFYSFEISMLRSVADDNLVFYLFSLLGRCASGAALYGHMVISLASRLIVDFFSPGGDAPDRPRLGPARALEKEGDYTGALQEYLVMARIYPHAPEIHRRMAECHLRLDQPAEAVPYLERALKMARQPGEALDTAARLAETLEHKLEKPEAARVTLEAFLRRFPEGAEANTVRERLQRPAPSRKAGAARPAKSGLAALEDTARLPAEEAAPPRKPRTRVTRKPASNSSTPPRETTSGDDAPEENLRVTAGEKGSNLESLEATNRPSPSRKKRSRSGAKRTVKAVEKGGKERGIELILASDFETPQNSGDEAGLESADVQAEATADSHDAPPESSTESWGLEALEDVIPEPLAMDDDENSADAKDAGNSTFTLEAMDDDPPPAPRKD